MRPGDRSAPQGTTDVWRPRRDADLSPSFLVIFRIRRYPPLQFRRSRGLDELHIKHPIPRS